LVAIRLELDFEGWKLRDTFTWNASDDVTSYDDFARGLCEDYGLPDNSFIPLIREAMATQIAEHVQTQALRPETTSKDTKGRLTTLRIPIKLDITVGAMNLVDQFEWDILDEDASAETFAHTFAADLGLTGEFETAIAHSIREQVDVHLRSLALAGHSFDSLYVSDDELRGAFLPEVSTVSRSGQDIEDHTPRLLQLSEFEVEKLERERERDNKRKRRQTRGR
ncbi:SNF5-domain-containing protein, partial [Jaminaea rosea]